MDDAEVIPLAQFRIDHVDPVWAIQANFRAVRAVGRLFPYRSLGTAGDVEGETRRGRIREQPEPEPW